MTKPIQQMAGVPRLARFFSRQTTPRKALLAVLPLLGIGLAVALATEQPNIPSDGASCAMASESEIEAWVKAKENSIPDTLGWKPVFWEVKDICSVARSSDTPQAFSPELLNAAIDLAVTEREEIDEQGLSPTAKRFLESSE